MNSPSSPSLATFDLERTVETLERHLPVELVPPQEQLRLRQAAAGMPPLWQWAVIETRLRAGEHRTDLMAAVSGLGEARHRTSLALDHPLHPSIEAGEDLLRSWSRQLVGLEGAEVVWFEWDAPDGESWSPLVLVFVDGRFGGSTPGRRLDPSEQLALTVEAHRLLHGSAPDPAQLAHLGSMIRAMPDAGRVLATGTLLPRGDDAYRLFASLPRDAVPHWLTQAGWTGDPAAVARWLPAVAPAWERVFVQVEVDADGVRPYLGLEPRQSVPGFPSRTDRAALLRRAVDEGLATSQKVDALLSWPGVSAIDADQRLIAVRNMHIKLVLRHEVAPEIKGYLGFHLRAAPGAR